ncbi:SMP-30/gluconolactonase/LRE family protein [Thermodesulfobacteriota bacterium]
MMVTPSQTSLRPGRFPAITLFPLLAVILLSGCAGDDGSFPSEDNALPEMIPVPNLLYQVHASFNSEDLAFRFGRGLVLGTCGALLTTEDPGNPPRSIPLTGELLSSPLGVAFGPSGDLYVCDSSGSDASVKRVSPTGDCEILADGFGENNFSLPNYIALSRAGDLYLSSTCDDMIYRISPEDGTVIEFLAVTGPNGIAFDEDETWLYITTENPAIFCDGSWTPGGLYRVPLGESGEPGELETLIEGFSVAGDGLAFDGEGNLYVVFSGLHGYGFEGLFSSNIFVYTPDGRFDKFLEVSIPGDIITNIAFGVEPFDPFSLYAYGFTGRLYQVEVGIRGLALPGN